jgi:Flp pilus assembly protein TadD
LIYIPDDKYLISKAIKYLLRVNMGKEALPFLEKNFNDFKDNYNEMMGIADQLFTYEFYEQAIPYYEQAKKLKPESGDMAANLALSYWRTGQKEAALKLMNEVYENYKTNPAILASEIDFLFKAGQDDQAKALLSKFRQIAPNHPKSLKLQGMMIEMEGNPMAAIPLYEASLKSDPTDPEVISKLGNILIAKREWNKAITLLRNSMKYHPNESILLERLGTLLISCPDPKLQNIPEGLELSERAFYHISSNMATLLSAGKNFALGNAMAGDFKTASYYMGITLNIARSEKVSQDYMDVLLKLESEINKALKN